MEIVGTLPDSTPITFYLQLTFCRYLFNACPFENKLYMRHEAEGFPLYVLTSAYEAEKAAFKKNYAQHSKIDDVPTAANIIGSPLINNFKVPADNVCP